MMLRQLVVAAVAMAARGKDISGCPLAPAYQDFKEPPRVRRDHFVLEVGTAMLCSPLTGTRWYTRAYGIPSEGIAPAVPAPTLVVQAGESLRIRLKNTLGPRNPTCEEAKRVNTRNERAAHRDSIIGHHFCHLNSTNFHTHGLHVTPAQNIISNGERKSADSIWNQIHPGETLDFEFPIKGDHMAGTHWYHPHFHHATSVQAGGGMHGALLVEDPAGSLPKEVEDMESKLMVISLLDLRFSLNKSWASTATLEKAGAGDLWKALNGKHKGSYLKEDHVIALVNGQWKPKLTLRAGRWYRLRMVFAAIELLLSVLPASEHGMKCDLKLLAKDGIYLHVAPRDIHKIYLAGGNRADVAISCKCLFPGPCDGRLESATASAAKNTEQQHLADSVRQFFSPFSKVDSDHVVQELVKLVVLPEAGSSARASPALPKFSVTRPCYLVDLRHAQVPVSNWARLDFWQDPWKVTWTDWFVRFKGVSMTDMDTRPLATMRTGEIYQFYVRGPEADGGGIAQHPLHTHVLPFQIASLASTDPFFQTGDWHDTLLHTSAQAVVKMLAGPFIGNHVVHCHILTHEDMGMMTYFKVEGEEGKEWPSERLDPTCFRRHGGAGFRYLDSGAEPGPAAPHWVTGPPGQDCHTTCAFLGGCLGTGWPTSEHDLQLITQGLGPGQECTVGEDRAAYHPSYSHGTCSWRTPALGALATAYRCGAEPPFGVARYCPCASSFQEAAPAQLV